MESQPDQLQPEPNRTRLVGIHSFAVASLIVLLLIVYGNSFTGTWIFDDASNIIDNPNVRMRVLDWESIRQSFKGLGFGDLTRPFSYLTFALNYFVSGRDPFGYHLVNFIIHILASLFLYLLIFKIQGLPRCRTLDPEIRYGIALLSAALWAIHPIQVTAVTYIVQRMASLAALFCFVSLFLYIKGRMAIDRNQKLGYWTGSCLAWLLAVSSKENAAMLPVGIWLMDLLLIQGVGKEKLKPNARYLWVACMALLGLGLIHIGPAKIFDGYGGRPFTLGQRLLAEPGVVLFYLKQIYYPVSSSFTLLHDVQLPVSVFDPWWILPNLSALLILIFSAILLARKLPLVSFAILFFFINHVIESTVLPLELIFEHRNYLPSAFLFLLPALLFYWCLQFFSSSRTVRYGAVAVIIILLVSQGHTVYQRNQLFQDEIKLWAENVRKSPQLQRPRHNLADALWTAGYSEAGLREMKSALLLIPKSRMDQKALSHYNLGVYYLYHRKEYSKALIQLYAALAIAPKRAITHYQIARALFNLQNYDAAQFHIATAVNRKPGVGMFRITQAWIRIKKGELETARETCLKLLKAGDVEHTAIYLLGEIYRVQDRIEAARWMFEKYEIFHPGQVSVKLALIEIDTILQDPNRSKERVFDLLAALRLDKMEEVLDYYHHNYSGLPRDRIERIRNAIKDEISRFGSSPD